MDEHIQESISISTNNNDLILDVSEVFVKKVLIGNFIICEIPGNKCQEYIQKFKDKVYLYTKYNKWLLIKNNANFYTIEYSGIIRNVWICKLVSFNDCISPILLEQNPKYSLDKLSIETIKTINARCLNSMQGLDSVHRKYINKHTFGNSDIIAIKSVAGSGKTTTLLNLAKIHKDKKILYLAFNKNLITEIRKKKSSNLYPRTFDSLMRDIFISETNTENPEIFDLKPQTIGNIIQWFEGKPYNTKAFYVKHFNKFCEQTEYSNIKDYCIKIFGTEKKLLNELWQKAKCLNLITFDSIKKLSEMNHWCKGILDKNYDMIFIDEAQDFNNIMLKILLEDTTIPKVFVGDPKQAIYQWRGSINAFEKLPEKTLTIEFYSTFRIGDPACDDIRNLFPDCWIFSKSKNITVLEFETEPNCNYTYLFRSWKYLMQSAQKISNIWINDFEKQIHFMKSLHSKLKNVKNVSKEMLNEFADDLPQFLLSLTEEQLAEIITDIENNLVSKSESTCKMYTIHSYKGLECNNVRIHEDVFLFNKNPIEQENLYYVALTRGMERIIVDKKVDIVGLAPEIDIKPKVITEIKKKKSPKEETYKKTLELFNQNKSIPEIAKEMQMTKQTIYNHIVKNIPNEAITFDKFMTLEEYNSIIEIIKYIEKDSTLKNIKERLPKSISYEQIKIAKKLISQKEI